MAKTATTGFYDGPEVAIRAFERWSGMLVSFHDLEQQLMPFLPQHRYSHQNDFCMSLKHEKGYEPACRRFELDLLRPYLQTHPEGCAKVCHAGILEWAVPVMHAGRLSAVLFAGLRSPGPDISVDLVDDRPTPTFAHWPVKQPQPERVTQEQSKLYLEGLRQLAARLQLWLMEHLREQGPEPTYGSEAERRQFIIERFIVERYQDPVTLDDLARELALSVSRTTHLVKEVCGRTFLSLLREHRLRRAAGMLWQTEHSVTEVAMECGFGDLSNFHKAFRKQFGMTPLEYRKHGSRR